MAENSDQKEGILEKNRPCWFVGASYGGSDDQTTKFFDEGIWVNDYQDRYHDLVNEIEVGDQIAIKAAYTRKKGLPFDNRGHPVSVMAIKAIGIVTENLGDGRNLRVDWEQLFTPPHEWYFYTYRGTIWKVIPNNWWCKGLYDFTFCGEHQDIERFRNDPYWAERFGTHAEIEKSLGEFLDLTAKAKGLKNRKEAAAYVVNADDWKEVNIRQLLFEKVGQLLASKRINLVEIKKSLQSSGIMPPHGSFGSMMNDFFKQPEVDVWLSKFEPSARIAEANEIENLIDDLVEMAFTGRDGKPKRSEAAFFLSIILSSAYPDDYMEFRQTRIDVLTQEFQVSKIQGKYGERFLALRNLFRTVVSTTVFHENFGSFEYPNAILGGLTWIFEYKDKWFGELQAGENKMKQTSKRNQTLNQILYGPPGTGKTYNTVIEAVRVCIPDFKGDYEEAKPLYDELKEKGRIEFITFHQSYGYEEFIEGIRPVMNENDSCSGDISYEIKKGIFKKICYDARNDVATARVVSESESEKYGISAESRVFKISIDGTGESSTRRYCFENSEARIGWGETGPIGNPENEEQKSYFNTLSSINKNTLHTFKDIQIGDVLLCIESSEKVAGIGVVSGEYRYDKQYLEGVHENYNHVLPTNWYVKDEKLPFLSINDGVRFVQKTVYPLYRIRPEVIVRKIVELLSPEDAASDIGSESQQIYALIIDEINRGNISKIFGELITLIEPDKRIGEDHAMTVRLPVSGDIFGVPNNLHIIGTMNTADRSIAMMDTALRRRFEFKEMMPQAELLNGVIVESVDIEKVLTTLNQRIEVLYDREHTIGHAYFISLNSTSTIKDLASVFANKVIPLLAEYFFEDWEKIRMVLGDNQKKNQGCAFIIESKEHDYTGLFGNVSANDFSDERKTFQRNMDALNKPESYIGIYKPDTCALTEKEAVDHESQGDE